MNGRNALHYAADYGQVEVVQLLLEKGAKIDVSNIHRVQSCICTKYCASKCNMKMLSSSCGVDFSVELQQCAMYVRVHVHSSCV